MMLMAQLNIVEYSYKPLDYHELFALPVYFPTHLTGSSNYSNYWSTLVLGFTALNNAHLLHVA